MLEVRHLSAGYGRARVLFDASLELRKGETAVLLGPNGAGKSTTLKAIMGLLAETHGEIFFLEKKILHKKPFEISQLGLGYVPEDRRIFGELTVEENLEVGHLPPRPGLEPWTPGRLYALFPNLGEARGREGARLSGGEQKMLALARTLMGNPLALLLDEPSEGIAPVLAARIADTIRDLKKEGMSVLLCEQNLEVARRIADRVYLIERGRISEHPGGVHGT